MDGVQQRSEEDIDRVDHNGSEVEDTMEARTEYEASLGAEETLLQEHQGQAGSCASGDVNHKQRTEEFANFWEGILKPPPSVQQDDLLEGDSNIEDIVLHVYYGASGEFFTTTHVEFSELLSRVPVDKREDRKEFLESSSAH